MTSGGNHFNDFPKNQQTKFRAIKTVNANPDKNFPPRGCLSRLSWTIAMPKWENIIPNQWRSTASEHWGMNSSFLSVSSLPFLPSPPFLGLGDLGERLSSPSGSGRSPAARCFLVHFRLKRTLLVIIIIKDVSYQSTVELSRQRLFDWQY